MAPRDSAATQERILAAATTEFAAKGIAGARVDDIAAAAGVNKRMLYYYFGSKEELFREILRRKLAERVASAAELGDLQRVDRAVVRQRDHLADRDYIRLLMWEALEDAQREGVVGEDDRREVYQGWVDSIRSAQTAGDIPKEYDPAQFVLTEMALTIFPAAFPQLARLVSGREVDDPEFLVGREQFLREFYGRLGPSTAQHGHE